MENQERFYDIGKMVWFITYVNEAIECFCGEMLEYSRPNGVANGRVKTIRSIESEEGTRIIIQAVVSKVSDIELYASREDVFETQEEAEKAYERELTLYAESQEKEKQKVIAWVKDSFGLEVV